MDSVVDIANPGVLQELYPNEVLQSVYWTERGSKHRKPYERTDQEAISRALDQAASTIDAADAVLFVTGAGAGVDMGLPDFRSSTTFWEQLAHPEITRYEDSSDNKWFDKDPEFAWGLNYYQIEMYRSASIHAGYQVMRQIATLKQQDNYFCWTTNVDGVLQRAGFEQDKVREVHGNIHRVQCTKYSCTDTAGIRDAWIERVELTYNPKTFRAESTLPQCYKCGALARPNIWYCTDSQYVYWKASSPISEAYFTWLDMLERESKKLVVIEIGAGLVIPSARVEAEDIAERLGGTLIRINPTDYAVPIITPTSSSPRTSKVEGKNEEKQTTNSADQFEAMTELPEESKLAGAIGIPLGAKAALTEIWARLQQHSHK